MFDTVVRRGLLIDGVHPPGTADLGISDGRIVAIGDLSGLEAGEVIDAQGMVVSPGFIDVHTHGDLLPFGAEPGALELAAIRQGVTTQIVGNCGFSVFAYESAPQDALRQHVANLLGDGTRVWPTVAQYAEDSVDAGLIMNSAALVGHGSVRACLLAETAMRAEDIGDALQRHIAAAVQAGVVGLSSGLVYAPGVYAETEELIAACRALRSHGLPYVTHVRGETDRIIDSISEAIRIASNARVPLHVSHHKVAGVRNWGKSLQTLAMLEGAVEDGVDVTVDVYPYTAASTSFHSLLPGWAQAGGFKGLLDLVGRPDVRDRLRREIAQGGDRRWENMAGAAGWEGVRIARLPGASDWEGLTVAELAARQNRDPLDAILDLQVLSGESITVVLDVLSDDDVSRVLASPISMIGSDGIPLPGKPHPRWAGSFARVLGRYTRDLGVLDLSTAVRKMAAMPAARFKLADRGILTPGAVADIVVFDPVGVEDMATFKHPLERPRGIEMVMVAGSVTMRQGEFTGCRAGTFLRPVLQ